MPALPLPSGVLSSEILTAGNLSAKHRPTASGGGRRLRGQLVRVAILSLAAGLGTLLLPASALAGLRVCNGSVDLVNVAIGYESEDGMRTEGWWTITANACSQILQEPLGNARYYLHVADGFGESRLGGDITLCIREEKFVLYDGDQCWQRGLIEADFFQVETDGAQDWTVLLSYD